MQLLLDNNTYNSMSHHRKCSFPAWINLLIYSFYRARQNYSFTDFQKQCYRFWLNHEILHSNNTLAQSHSVIEVCWYISVCSRALSPASLFVFSTLYHNKLWRHIVNPQLLARSFNYKKPAGIASLDSNEFLSNSSKSVVSRLNQNLWRYQLLNPCMIGESPTGTPL